MNPEPLIASMDLFPAQLRAETEKISDDQLRWRPAPGAWSLLEIVGHVLDEEKLDFRTRLASTLEDPGKTWDPIDPPSWVTEHRYDEATLSEVLAEFDRERADSVRWLRSLEAPDWENCYSHPQLGPIRAGDLLTAWAAHDPLHLRQIAQRKFAWLLHHSGEYHSKYAGEW